MPKLLMNLVQLALLGWVLLWTPRTLDGQTPMRRLPIAQRTDPMARPLGREEAARRDSLLQRARERMGEMVQRQLQLSDEQARRLRTVTARLEPRRRALIAEEFAVRTALRAQIAAGDSASDGEVAALLGRMIDVQRARTVLMENEQQELSAFLTPIQRAKYLGLEEQMRLRAEQLLGRPLPGQGPPSGAAPGIAPGLAPGAAPGMRPRMTRRPPMRA